jgi:peptide/nickel transport system permease protein
VAGFVFLSLVVCAAVFADFLAGDRPIAYSLDGELHVLPWLFGPSDSAEQDNRTILEAVSQRGGWIIVPPVPVGPNQTKVNGNVNWLSPPNRNDLMGTDDSGRSVLARIIHSARSALLVGLGSAGLSAVIGLIFGALAGYFGGLADRVCLRLLETLSSFPSLFLILVLQGLIGSTSLLDLVFIIGLTRWTDVATLTRAEVLRIVNEDYITAARALGLNNLKILWRHVLPGAMGPVVVAATFGFASAILIESTLSFLGFGVPPTTPSWGQLLTDAFRNEGCYWLSIFPGLALFLTVLSINLVGEGMREALDRSAS